MAAQQSRGSHSNHTRSISLIIFRGRKIQIQIQTQQITSLLLNTTSFHFAGIFKTSVVAAAVAPHVAAEGLAGHELRATNGALVDLVVTIDQFELLVVIITSAQTKLIEWPWNVVVELLIGRWCASDRSILDGGGHGGVLVAGAVAAQGLKWWECSVAGFALVYATPRCLVRACR